MKKIDVHALDVVAKTLWGEARGEGRTGMKAVAHVIKNRADISKQNGGYWWGNGLVGVCKKPWQFSCWNKSDPNRAKLEGSKLYSNLSFSVALEVAEEVLTGQSADITNGANHYHTKDMDSYPKWAAEAKPVAEIGNHLFYKL